MLTTGLTATTGTPDRNITNLVMDAFLQAQSDYQDYFNVYSTTREQEKLAAVSGLGAFPVMSEGTKVNLDEAVQRFTATYSQVDYALAFRATHKMKRGDGELGILAKLAAALGFSASDTIDTLCSLILDRAFDSAYTYGDGEELIMATHPTAGSTQSNLLTVAADLTSATLNLLYAQAATLVNFRGLTSSTIPDTLVYAPANFEVATQLTQSPVAVGASNATINVFGNGRLKGAQRRKAADTDAWFLLDSNPVKNPLQIAFREFFESDSHVEPGKWGDEIHMGHFAATLPIGSYEGILGTPGA